MARNYLIVFTFTEYLHHNHTHAESGLTHEACKGVPLFCNKSGHSWTDWLLLSEPRFWLCFVLHRPESTYSLPFGKWDKIYSGFLITDYNWVWVACLNTQGRHYYTKCLQYNFRYNQLKNISKFILNLVTTRIKVIENVEYNLCKNISTVSIWLIMVVFDLSGYFKTERNYWMTGIQKLN